MPRLPRVSGRKAARAFEQAGFIRQRMRGSHAIYSLPDGSRPLSVPMTNKPLPPGTLRRLVRDAGLTVEEFIRLLD
ncbi:MAG: type II toxin-antitoxin system HicA family toxin [Armatimonadetes bacterium]|nr:type II toxin-antitoxin system HicA family toxin [Armatimonadota bacterium]